MPPGSPERCQPKLMVLVGGRVETQREKRLTDMLPTSVSRWAASVMMARLWARYPPAGAEQLAPCALAAPHTCPCPAVTYHLPDHEDTAEDAGDAQLPAGLEPPLAGAGGEGAAPAVGSRGARWCQGLWRACKETGAEGHSRPHRLPVPLPGTPGTPGSHSLARGSRWPGHCRAPGTRRYLSRYPGPVRATPAGVSRCPGRSRGPCRVPAPASLQPVTTAAAAVPAGCAPAPAHRRVPLPHRAPRLGRRRGTGNVRRSRARGGRAPRGDGQPGGRRWRRRVVAGLPGFGSVLGGRSGPGSP